jgi:hypothetical protein
MTETTKRVLILVHRSSAGKKFCSRLVNKIFAGLRDGYEVTIKESDKTNYGVKINDVFVDEAHHVR